MNGRILAIDWTRGLLMIVMALDHASLYWNQGRIHDEGLNGLYQTGASWGQFFTRFLSHPCAPGFMFISGLALFISMQKQNKKKKTLFSQNLHYLFRGITLIALDFILINRLGWTFGVLACMGVCMIILSHLRFAPIPWIIAVSIGLLIVHPLLAGVWKPDTLAESYLLHVFTESARLKKNLAVLYPVIPWIGIMGIGYALAQYLRPLWIEGKTLLISKILCVSGIMLLAFFYPLRVYTDIFYGDNSSFQGVFSQSFWLLSKYPPSLAFFSWNMGWVCILMGIFSRLENTECRFLKFFEILKTFGQVPLFFYVVHRYIYKIFPSLTGTLREYSLPTTYIVWAAGLVPLYYFCQWYMRLFPLFLKDKK
jgi:uncharacterized membrane protein